MRPAAPGLGLTAELQAILARGRERRAAEAARQAVAIERLRAVFVGACRACLDGLTGAECPHCERGRAAIHDREERASIAHRQAQIEILREGGVPERRWNQTLRSYPGDQSARWFRDLCEWLRGWDGHAGLILAGDYGTGKTGLLTACMRYVAQSYAGTGQRMRFLTATELLDNLRDGIDDDTLQDRMWHLRTVSLLAIDDIGAEKPSEWTRERLTAVVNARLERGLPLWLTTNYTLDDLERSDRLGRRMVDRLDETCDMFVLRGPSLRARRARG